MKRLKRQKIFILLVCWQDCNFRVCLSSVAFYFKEGRKTELLEQFVLDLSCVCGPTQCFFQQQAFPMCPELPVHIRLDGKYNCKGEFCILACKIRKDTCERSNWEVERKGVAIFKW